MRTILGLSILLMIISCGKGNEDKTSNEVTGTLNSAVVSCSKGKQVSLGELEYLISQRGHEYSRIYNGLSKTEIEIYQSNIYNQFGARTTCLMQKHSISTVVKYDGYNIFSFVEERVTSNDSKVTCQRYNLAKSYILKERKDQLSVSSLSSNINGKSIIRGLQSGNSLDLCIKSMNGESELSMKLSGPLWATEKHLKTEYIDRFSGQRFSHRVETSRNSDRLLNDINIYNYPIVYE